MEPFQEHGPRCSQFSRPCSSISAPSNGRLAIDVEPTFKGVWYAAVNFAPLPLRDTRLDQCPRPRR